MLIKNNLINHGIASSLFYFKLLCTLLLEYSLFFYHDEGLKVLKVKMAALQVESRVGDLEWNLHVCEKLANEAAEKGAKWIIFPEFFTTGMAFDARIIGAIQPRDGGEALKFMLHLAKMNNAYIGGSFLIRNDDNTVRNTFFLVSPDGILGRHDKDIPTMWEHCFFEGGKDDGIVEVDGQQIGMAVCWEFMRSKTARRLKEKVDIIVGGNCWWSVPNWSPKFITGKWEKQNEKTSYECVRTFSTYVGAPIVHASHVGSFACQLPWAPVTYRGHYEGGAIIVDGEGNVLGFRDRREGAGVVVADVKIGRTTPARDIPNRYWLHPRGVVPAVAWHYQRWHGKRWYRKNVLAVNNNRE